MRRRKAALVASFAAVALVASACGFRDGDAEIDVGVTEDPCPNTPNEDNGCIYLGTISDLSEGPFAALAQPITEAQEAFWARVNEDGGIGGYDIDVTSFVRDNQYNPEIHNQVYRDIRDDVLALAQTLGSPQTAAILPDMEGNDVIGAPASWSSEWLFEDVILQAGTNYCLEAMNSVDYAVDELGAESVVAVHYAGDYGDDAAGGAEIAAEERGLDFRAVETPPGTDNQGDAIQAVLSEDPDMVMLTTAPADAAVVVGQTAARGFEGTFIGSSPTWNPALLDSPAADAFEAQYLHAAPWASWDADTPGHEAMRAELEGVTPNEGYTAGWTWSYAMREAIEQAVEAGDLTREGLREAAGSLESVDYEGILPDEAGNYAGEPDDAVFRESLLNEVDTDAPTGLTLLEDFFAGPTAEQHEMTEPCF
ncbi:ABC transporter substrate-binding protein [Haloechinothrix sp. LS1_15]|uniref:ABC transporter substrate-binding protein n=1 Tax=Haloechinothrix sp. LS1_15 TaxID=2652248 RepID=UPI0029447711|nr:ABC transporter substrate-binding protein [Haloechinothrix sp. LS1_15]MDV6011459.1 ABC transporter substrate-binding protein [Haloechinothrix sp. LS1_15]